MKFKNNTQKNLSFPTLKISVKAGETYTAKTEDEAKALINSVLESVEIQKKKKKTYKLNK